MLSMLRLAKGQCRICSKQINQETIAMLKITTTLSENQALTTQQSQEMTHQSTTLDDLLANLPNPHVPHEQLSRTFNVERRKGKQAAMLTLSVDLDNFEAIYDNFGYAAADELLQQIAERLRQRLRDSDAVVRLDCDEFVVLLEDLHSPDNAEKVANELIEILTPPFKLAQNDNVQLGTNIGVSFFPQHDNDSDD